MDWNVNIVSALSFAATFTGLLIAVIQTLRIRKLKKEENADIWLTIRLYKNISYHLERVENDADCHVPKALDSANSIFRTQLKRAVLNEKKYTIKTIEKWRRVKKISTEWQEKQALNFLDTKNIPDDIHILDNHVDDNSD